MDKRWGRGPINSVNRFLCRPVSIFQHSRLSSAARHTEHALPKDLREPYDFWRPSPEPSTKSHSSATATRISHTRLPHNPEPLPHFGTTDCTVTPLAPSGTEPNF